MKIIISPAKKMICQSDLLEASSKPVFLEKTKQLLEYLKGLSYEEAKELWKCNDKIARLNYERIQTMHLDRNLTPALLSYEGIQYQYMAPSVMEEEQLGYLQKHLRILSGFYGLLRPLDGVVPYRLEMQAKARPAGYENLYEFWGNALCQELTKEEDCIVNLASKEYVQTIERHCPVGVQILTCVFGEVRGDKVIQKGTLAKMARGEMVRYMAKRKVLDLNEWKEFSGLNFVYREDLSKKDQFVYVFSCKSDKDDI